MKKGLFNRRVPTILALLILVVVIGVSTVLIQNGIFYIGKAAPDSQPQNFSITNITDTSFTAVFTTSGLVDSVVNMDEANASSSIVLDDRDKKTGNRALYYSHHITVPNLSPQKTYYFKLIIGNTHYENSAYKVITGKKIIEAPPAQNPLFGKILLPDGASGSDSIVIANSGQSQNISSVTDGKGEFILPTNSLRNNQNSSYVLLANDSPIELHIARQSMTASILTLFKTAQNLPTVMLSQKYSFIEKKEDQPKGISQLNFSLPIGGSTVSITSPQQGESYIDKNPNFYGTSYPNSSINLSISKVIQQQVLTKADGSWNYQPNSSLAQGDYSLTISVVDPENKKITLTRDFSIFPLGSQVVESATPSATPKPKATATPTLKPTRTPTPTPTISPTPTIVTPTLTPAATSTPIPSMPTATISLPTATIVPSTPTSLPISTTKPTNRPTIKAPGAMENTVALTGFSIVLITIGIALLFAL